MGYKNSTAANMSMVFCPEAIFGQRLSELHNLIKYFLNAAKYVKHVDLSLVQDRKYSLNNVLLCIDLQLQQNSNQRQQRVVAEWLRRQTLDST